MSKSWFSKGDENARIVIRISLITIVINLLLVISKSILGAMFGNLSVLSDAIHSGSDLFTSFLIIAAVFLSSPKRDNQYNYGREKVEPLVVLFLALIIGGVGIFLGWEGIQGLISPEPAELNFYLIAVTVLSILVKEGMFWYEMHYAKKINSAMLKADAWHSRSDSLASVAVLIGLICSTFMETDIIESIAVLVVALFILKVAFDIAKPSIGQLLDKSAGEEAGKEIRKIVLEIEGVKGIDVLNTRLFGNKIYVDIEVSADGALTLEESHKIAHEVHDTLEAHEELRIKHAQVHVTPIKEEPICKN